VPCLYDVDIVEHVKEALSFDGHCEFVIKHVEKDVCSMLVWRCDRKVTNLTFKDDMIAPLIVPE
jgi:hypothetical protein